MGLLYAQDAGISPGAAGFQDRMNLPRVNLSMKNVGASAAVFQWTDYNGARGEPITIGAGSPMLIRDTSVTIFSVTGNGAQLVLYGSYPEFIDPQYITLGTVAGTVKTDVGQGTAPTPNIIISSDVTDIAGNIVNQTANFPLNRLPKATDGGVLTGTS